MIKKKSDALKSIRKITKNVRGKDYEVFEIYFGTDPATGRKIRQCRSTEKDAAACVDEFYKGLREYGNPATGLLRQAEVYDARTAIDILAKAGVKLTVLPFLLKACAHLLREQPNFNVSLAANGKQLIQKIFLMQVNAATNKPLIDAVYIKYGVGQKHHKPISH